MLILKVLKLLGRYNDDHLNLDRADRLDKCLSTYLLPPIR